MNKLRIKKGDTVKVLSGKDKGKTGKVLTVLPKVGKVVVDSVNIHTKFEKSKKAGEKGKKITYPGAMNISKVALLDPHSGLSSRVGFQVLENGSKQRVAKKSGKAV